MCWLRSMRPPRTLLALSVLTVAILAVPWEPIQVRLRAAMTVVQSCGNGGNDISCTFGSGWTSGNSVFIVGIMTTQTAGQLDITGITATETSFGEINVGASNRAYGFCFVVSGADIGDTAFVGTTVGGSNAWMAAIEVSGADACNEDGTEQASTDSTSPYNFSSTLTTTVDGSTLLGIIKSSSTSNYAAGTGATAVPSDGADFPGGNDAGTALGGYRITTTAGAQDLEFTSAAGETSTAAVYALKAAVASSGPPLGSLSLLGVGR